MRIEIDLAVFRETKWHEYALRFAFGGVMTVVAGLVASKFGPGIGGLFLACPSIFPASATLIEKHERQRKERLGLEGSRRGKEAASIDAAGAAMGSVGLLLFAFLSWKLLPHHRVGMALAISTVGWLLLSAIVWHFRKRDQKVKIL